MVGKGGLGRNGYTHLGVSGVGRFLYQRLHETGWDLRPASLPFYPRWELPEQLEHAGQCEPLHWTARNQRLPESVLAECSELFVSQLAGMVIAELSEQVVGGWARHAVGTPDDSSENVGAGLVPARVQGNHKGCPYRYFISFRPRLLFELHTPYKLSWYCELDGSRSLLPITKSIRRPGDGADLAKFLLDFVPRLTAVGAGIDIPMQAVCDDDVRIRWVGAEPVDGGVRFGG